VATSLPARHCEMARFEDGQPQLGRRRWDGDPARGASWVKLGQAEPFLGTPFGEA
jgi:hypothetical protein